MTKKQTRMLGIEFERRLQTMDPTLIQINKLDTDDIYAYLNEYQQLYVKQLYTAEDQVPIGTNTSIRISDQLKPLLSNKILTKSSITDITYDGRYIMYNLPDDYYMYVRSTSSADIAYNNKSGYSIPNVLIDQNNVHKVIESAYDTNKIIRNPIVVLSTSDDKPVLQLIHDVYTNIIKVSLTYIKQPNRFGIDDDDDACELPIDCFEDLVSGAVNLYLTYKYPGSNRKQDNDKKDERKEEVNEKH